MYVKLLIYVFQINHFEKVLIFDIFLLAITFILYKNERKIRTYEFIFFMFSNSSIIDIKLVFKNLNVKEINIEKIYIF